MNIVLINHYAGSPDMGLEFRPYYFAKEWVALGHKVSIIAADFSHLRRKNPKVKHDFQSENIDGIDYYWIKTGRYKSNGVKRALTMFLFVFKLMIKTSKIIKKLEPDVVICSSTYPLDTYAGQRIRKKSSKKVLLVHEIHDMWPLTPIELGEMSRNNPFIRIMQCGEDSFCKHADRVVSLLSNAKDYLVAHGMDECKFSVVTNGIALDEWDDFEPLNKELVEHFNDMSKSGYFNLCYCGSIHKSAALEYLIDAVKEKDNVALTLIGPGFDKQELKQRTIGHENRIVFFDAISKKSIPNIFQYIDAFFVGSKNYPLNRFGMCMNKVFDAMMGGKPILYAVNAPNNYIKEYNCGVSVNPENKESIENGIDILIGLSDKERGEMGERGRMAAINRFNYKKLAQKFLDAFEK